MRFILSFVLISFFGFAFQTCENQSAKTDKPDVAKKTADTAPKASQQAPQDDAPRITLADAKKDFDAGNAVFVDTRGADAYKTEHIKGAINVTLNDFEARYKEIPTGKKIIVYCS